MYPREIVDKALRLKAQGWTDKTVAEACEVSIWAVRHWRTGRRRDPSRPRVRPATYCPICSDGELDPAPYAYLLGLYLGDGYIVESKKQGVYFLSVFCCDAYPGLIEECRTAMATVFPISPFKVRREGCTEVKAASKHWPCIFPQHGPGVKHSRVIALEEWQCEIVDEYPRELLRGLIHSDGCRVTNRVRRKVAGQWKYYAYPRYMFSNTSEHILGIMGDALDLLGVQWSFRWHEHDNPRHSPAGTISIAERHSVAFLDTFIGDKH
jgi:hypothetical protein